MIDPKLKRDSIYIRKWIKDCLANPNAFCTEEEMAEQTDLGLEGLREILDSTESLTLETASILLEPLNLMIGLHFIN